MQYFLVDFKAVLIEHLKHPRPIVSAYFKFDQIDEIRERIDARIIYAFH